LREATISCNVIFPSKNEQTKTERQKAKGER
jgi:hypothetical protein